MTTRFELRPTDDGSLTVFDREAGECYKSRHAARLEAEHVFFRPGVLENARHGAEDFAVLELGFGLGTNFRYFLSAGFRGEYVSIERDLEGARFLLENDPDPAVAALLERKSYESGGMRARLLVGDFFCELRSLAHAGFAADAILFDPFSPKANPEAWTSELFLLAAAVLRPGGRLVTYSVSRAAKDAALSAGLRVEKRDLPAALRKRSSLLAIRPGEA